MDSALQGVAECPASFETVDTTKGVDTVIQDEGIEVFLLFHFQTLTTCHLILNWCMGAGLRREK